MSCLRSSSLLPLHLLVLAVLVCCTSAAPSNCHIAQQWSLHIADRSVVDVSAILPAPYCLLLSDYVQNSGDYYYALDVRNGSVAWQWPAEPYHDIQQVKGLQPSSHPERVYAAVSYVKNENTLNESMCLVVAALHSGNGSAIWQHELCFHTAIGVVPTFIVMQPPPAHPTLGERLLLALSSNYLQIDHRDGVVEAIDGNTGAHLSSANLTNALDWSIQPVGHGEDGFFTFKDINDLETVQLLQLLSNNTINQTANFSTPLTNAVLNSQPALQWEMTTTNERVLIARDVVSDKRVWSSNDSFLTGEEWGTNGTFTHDFTAYILVDSMPHVFLALNAAHNDNPNRNAVDGFNRTVVAQIGCYELASGKQVSRSPLLTFEHLGHVVSNPTTWQFDNILLLRGDTVWYTLELPSLKAAKSGHYVTDDAWQGSNNWLVDTDGSYVALVYQSDEIVGYPPYVSSGVEAGSEQQQPAGVGRRRHTRGQHE